MTSISKAMSVLSGVFLAVLTAACVSTAAPANVNGPASPEGQTAPPPGGASVLASAQQPAGSGVQPLTATEHAHEQGVHEPAVDTHAADAEHDHAAQNQAAHSGHDHSAHAQKEQATLYICPMHPEIRENKPGRCPKCGMNLEPAKPDGK